MSGLTIILSGKIRCRIRIPDTQGGPPNESYHDSESVFLVSCPTVIPGTTVAVQAKYPSFERQALDELIRVNEAEKMVGMITIVHGDQVHMWPVLESADLYTDVWEL